MTRYVTANFNHSDSSATRHWLREAMSGETAIIFGQEMPSRSMVVEAAAECDYQLVWPVPERPIGRLPSSALLVRAAHEVTGTPGEIAGILEPFGTYVTAAVVALPRIGDALCISFHASPGPLTPEAREVWPWTVPSPRQGSSDGRWVPRKGEVFYSDLFIEALRLVGEATELPLLAAGDLNSARGWDLVPGHEGHSWGAEMFDGIERLGLTNVTWTLWDGVERTSRFHPTHPQFQLDYFLTTALLDAVASSAWIDPGWQSAAQIAVDGRSDHAPVWLASDRLCVDGAASGPLMSSGPS